MPLSEEEMVRQANERQRALSDEEVIRYFGCCPPSSVELGREILTNEFYDQLVEREYPESMKVAPREEKK